MKVLTTFGSLAAVAAFGLAQVSAAQVTQPIALAKSDEGYVTTTDGVRLHFTRLGSGNRVLVVLNEIYMIDDFSSLAEKHTVIFYDLRNRGRSDPVSDPEKLKRGVLQEVDDLESVRRHFGLERFSVIAHSYPSVIAALYAMKHPSTVERVVQIGPPPADMRAPIPPQYRHSDALSGEVFAALQKLQSQNPTLDELELCRRSWELLRPMYVGRREDATRLSHWGFCDLPNERGAMIHFRRNILPSLESLQIPASDYAKASMPFLIVHGTHDRNAPYGGGREWARQLPNARLLTAEGAAHVPYVEDRKRVLSAINLFLSGQWPADAQALR